MLHHCIALPEKFAAWAAKGRDRVENDPKHPFSPRVADSGVTGGFSPVARLLRRSGPRDAILHPPMRYRALASSMFVDRFDDAIARDRSAHAIIIAHLDRHRFARNIFARAMMRDAQRDRCNASRGEKFSLRCDATKHAMKRRARLVACVVR